MNYRTLRVGKLILGELSKIIERELEFGALATLTEVNVSRKMDTAKVGVSVIPSKKSEEVLICLNKHRGELQHLLNKKLGIRPMPRIHFEIDRGLENAAKIEKRILESGSGV